MKHWVCWTAAFSSHDSGHARANSDKDRHQVEVRVFKLSDSIDEPNIPENRMTVQDNLSVGGSLSSAVENLQSIFMSGPESSMEYVASGAEDGLSR